MDTTQNSEKIFKLKEGFLLRRIGESRMMIPLYQNVANFNGVIRLNETAEVLLTLLKEGAGERMLTEALTKEYDVSEEKASADVQALLSLLEEHGMLEA